MDKAVLPTEKAHEPNEGARNPMVSKQLLSKLKETNKPGEMSPYHDYQASRRHLTFAEDTDLSEKSGSQTSYKDVLSQPAPGLSHRQKLLWLQKRRTYGLWVQCDECDRWRFLPNVLDSNELPNKWYCRMNPDPSIANCSVPEVPIRLREEEDLIHSLYSAGSVVWARMPGWPWWPAMVDDCPDTEQFYWLDGFSDIPTHYNVVFFDSTDVTRAWIAPDNLKPFVSNRNLSKLVLKGEKNKIRLQAAMVQADDAAKLALVERLGKYSFISRFKGTLKSPPKVTAKDLIRYQKKIKRKFNIEIPIEIDDEVSLPKSPMKKSNMIILGKPKVSKDRIKTRFQDCMNLNDSPIVAPLSPPLLPVETETATTEASEPGLKQHDSMEVQVGSTNDTVQATESYDNDTSKTYVPEFRRTVKSTDDTLPEMETQESEVRVPSPNSDDFDF